MTEKEIKIANVGPPKEIVYENTRIIAPKMAVIEKKKDSTRIDLDGKLKKHPRPRLFAFYKLSFSNFISKFNSYQSYTFQNIILNIPILFI